MPDDTQLSRWEDDGGRAVDEARPALRVLNADELAEIPHHGFGVTCEVVWREDVGGDGEATDVPDQVDVYVVPIAPELIVHVGDMQCVPIPGLPGALVPLRCFASDFRFVRDDPYGLASVWFPTLEAAEAHAQFIRTTLDNPRPWSLSLVVMQ
jgi:hypothetical protein